MGMGAALITNSALAQSAEEETTPSSRVLTLCCNRSGKNFTVRVHPNTLATMTASQLCSLLHKVHGQHAEALVIEDKRIPRESKRKLLPTGAFSGPTITFVPAVKSETRMIAEAQPPAKNQQRASDHGSTSTRKNSGSPRRSIGRFWCPLLLTACLGV